MADKQKRVRLPDAKPGQVFAYELSGEVVKLTPVKKVEREHRAAKFKLVKRDGFPVIETNRFVSQETIDDLLSDPTGTIITLHQVKKPQPEVEVLDVNDLDPKTLAPKERGEISKKSIVRAIRADREGQ
jgi:hypothetical protein